MEAAKAEEKKEPVINPNETNIDDDLMNEVINELGIEGVDANELNKMVDDNPKKDGDKKDADKDKK